MIKFGIFMENNDPLTADFILKLGGALLGELKKNQDKTPEAKSFSERKKFEESICLCFYVRLLFTSF